MCIRANIDDEFSSNTCICCLRSCKEQLWIKVSEKWPDLSGKLKQRALSTEMFEHFVS